MKDFGGPTAHLRPQEVQSFLNMLLGLELIIEHELQTTERRIRTRIHVSTLSADASSVVRPQVHKRCVPLPCRCEGGDGGCLPEPRPSCQSRKSAARAKFQKGLQARPTLFGLLHPHPTARCRASCTSQRTPTSATFNNIISTAPIEPYHSPTRTP